MVTIVTIAMTVTIVIIMTRCDNLVREESPGLTAWDGGTRRQVRLIPDISYIVVIMIILSIIIITMMRCSSLVSEQSSRLAAWGWLRSWQVRLLPCLFSIVVVMVIICIIIALVMMSRAAAGCNVIRDARGCSCRQRGCWSPIPPKLSLLITITIVIIITISMITMIVKLVLQIMEGSWKEII